MYKLLIAVIAVSTVLFGLSWLSGTPANTALEQSALQNKETGEQIPVEKMIASADTQAEEISTPSALTVAADTVSQEPATAEAAQNKPMDSGVTVSPLPAAQPVSTTLIARAVEPAAATPSTAAVHNVNRSNMAQIVRLDKYFEP